MIVIPENLITTASLVDPDTGNDIADSNFPAVNMIDQHPQKVAKATQSTAKVTTGSIKWLKAFAVVNVACSKITKLKVKDSGGVTVFSEDEIPLMIAGSYFNYFHAVITQKDRFFIVFDRLYADATIEFVLNYPDTQNAYIGLFMAGLGYEIGTAQWGIADDPEDYSIIHETSNGSLVAIKGNILKNKSYKIFATKEEYERFYQLARDYRTNFWSFIPATDIDYAETYMRYGSLKKIPKTEQKFKNYIEYNFEVREVI